MMDLASTLQEIRQLIAEFKQQQSNGPIQAGTSCNDNNKDSRKKVNNGNPKVFGQERTKDHNDDQILTHVSGDEIEIEDNNANKNEQRFSNISGVGDQDPLSSYSSKVRSS